MKFTKGSDESFGSSLDESQTALRTLLFHPLELMIAFACITSFGTIEETGTSNDPGPIYATHSKSRPPGATALNII